MPYDPTQWKSHEAAYKYWAHEKHYWEKEVQVRRQQLTDKHGAEDPDLQRIIQTDKLYRDYISNETWARTQAEYYCQQLILDNLSRLLLFAKKDE